MTIHAIEINNLTKKFGQKTAIDNLSLQIGQGELFGFLGPSGAGKTTTIKMLTGQLKQDFGNAKILGQDTTKLNNNIFHQLGMVTDNSGLYEDLTVYENLNLFAKILNVKKTRIQEVLEKTKLTDQKKKRVKALSKGMKQRLLLARAVLHQPKLLFLDEPTSGLDVATQIEIHKLMLELKETGTTFFLTTHNMPEAEKLCDRVAIFHQGQIQAIGVPDDLKDQYNVSSLEQVFIKLAEVA